MRGEAEREVAAAEAAAIKGRLLEATHGQDSGLLDAAARAMFDAEAPPGRDPQAAWDSDAKVQGLWRDRARRALQAALDQLGSRP